MANFWERAARSVDPMFSLYNVYLKFYLFSHFDFDGMILDSDRPFLLVAST